MKLESLLRCVIYRDGGSLEAVWRTNTGEDYAATMLVSDWDHPGDRVTYFLFNCRLDSIIPHRRIDRGSREHR